MDLKSIFQRKPGRVAAPSADAPADLVQRARLQARRRLIGAVVLVVVGVIGFPLLFETQPRPIPVDIPIIVPRRDSAPALAMPAQRSSRQTGAAALEQARASGMEEGIETPVEAGRDVTGVKSASPPQRGESSRNAAPSSSGVASPSPSGVAAASSSSGAKRMQAGPDASVAERAPAERSGRYVVQVGAFADSTSAREVRQKVERLGLKTYTQVAETANGQRVRVRVGPFATREEADRALAKIKASGAPAVVITL